MSIDSFRVVSVDLSLISLEQIECNIIGVRLNCIGEEFDLEWNFVHLDELKRKSESSRKNEDLDNFFGNHEFGMSLQQLDDIVVAEDDFGVKGESILTLVLN